MKILIYTTHRTGSTALAQLLMAHYGCDYHRGSLIYPLPTDIIIKITPSESKYNEIQSYFDKKIVLTRDNIKDQAESRVYADLVEKKFEPYTIEKSFLLENHSKILEMEQTIIKENEYLLSCDDCLFLTEIKSLSVNAPQSVVITGVPQACDSMFTLPNGSRYNVGTKVAIALPINSARCSGPTAPTYSPYCGICVPGPAIISFLPITLQICAAISTPLRGTILPM